MSSSLVICRSNGVTVNGGNTRDSSISGHLNMAVTASEALTQVPITASLGVTFRHMYVFVSANGTTADSTFKLRKNGADTALGVTIDFGLTGTYIDTSNSVSFTGGALASYRIVAGASSSLTLRAVSIQADATEGQRAFSFMVARGVVSLTTDNANRYMLPNGYMDSINATESVRQFRMKTAGSFINMAVYVSDNLRAASATEFRVRKNGADGNNFVSVAALATGLTKYTGGGQDTFAVDDDVGYEISTGAGTNPFNFENISIAFISSEFMSTGRYEFIMLSGHGTGINLNAGSLSYFTPAGRLFAEGTEDQAELGNGNSQYSNFAFQARQVGIYIGSNSLDVTVDAIFLRENRVSLPKIRITSGTTGVLVADIIGTYKSGTTPFSYEVDLQAATSGTLGLVSISSIGTTHKAPVFNKRSSTRYALTR